MQTSKPHNSSQFHIDAEIAQLIAQTKEQLQQEYGRIKGMENAATDSQGIHTRSSSDPTSSRSSSCTNSTSSNTIDVDECVDINEDVDLGSSAELTVLRPQSTGNGDGDIEEETTAHHNRQKLLNAEVVHLGQSIAVKEQLLSQLMRSQQQYSAVR